MNTQETTTLKERTKQSNKQLFIWTLGWVVSLAIVAFGPKFIWGFDVTFSVIAILVNLFFGYKMIMANRLQLQNLDEMQRQVHMNAMAITLGVSLVFIPLYGLMEHMQILEMKAHPSNILFLMSFTYVISMVLGFRKYQ